MDNIACPRVNIPGFAGRGGMPIGLSVVCGRFNGLHLLYAGKAIGAIFEKEGGFQSRLV